MTKQLFAALVVTAVLCSCSVFEDKKGPRKIYVTKVIKQKPRVVVKVVKSKPLVIVKRVQGEPKVVVVKQRDVVIKKVLSPESEVLIKANQAEIGELKDKVKTVADEVADHEQAGVQKIKSEGAANDAKVESIQKNIGEQQDILNKSPSPTPTPKPK